MPQLRPSEASSTPASIHSSGPSPALSPTVGLEGARSSAPPLSRRSLLAIATVLATTAAGAGCASRPEVRHDRAPGVDFASYKTFAFQALRDPARGALGTLGADYTTLQEARLRQAAAQELERQGLTQVAHDPDLRVHLAMKVVQRQELHTSPGARGLGVGYRGWTGTRLDTVDVRLGSLVVDLVDARRNALVWRGVAEGAIERADAQDPAATIERAVADVFAGFKR